MQGAFKYHQYQVVGRHLPTEHNENPELYRMKLWASDTVAAKSKFWCVAVSVAPPPSPMEARHPCLCSAALGLRYPRAAAAPVRQLSAAGPRRPFAFGHSPLHTPLRFFILHLAGTSCGSCGR